MSWKEAFENGVADFKNGQLQAALSYMNEAAELRADNYRIYDSRAAIYEKLGNLKAALLDSKRAIDIAPDRWQGYARAARMFSALHKHESAVKMVDYALSRLPLEDKLSSGRRRPLIELRERSLCATQERTARTKCHIGVLPLELLTEVFSILVDQEPCCVIGLSHVCDHWRKVVIAMPALWRTLVLSNKHPVRKIKLWMERSKSKLSSLILRASLPTVEHATVLYQLWQLQWGHLETLHVHGNIAYALLLDSRATGSLVKLKRISLDSCGVVPDMSEPDRGLAPNELSILGETMFFKNSFCQLNLLRILHIRISARCVHSFGLSLSSMMRDAPLLEDFVLEFSAPAEIPREVDSPPLDAIHLTSIELRNVKNPSLLLNRVNAPSLRHLTIFGAASRVDEGLLHIICDGRDSSVISLQIGSCALGADTLVSLLSRVPRLERLQIYGVDEVVNRVLRFLAGNGPSGGLASDMRTSLPCPYLKDVDVSRCSDLETSSAHSLVKRRLQAEQVGEGWCCRIESLRTDGCPKMDADMLPWFRSNVGQFSCVFMTKKEARRWR